MMSKIFTNDQIKQYEKLAEAFEHPGNDKTYSYIFIASQVNGPIEIEGEMTGLVGHTGNLILMLKSIVRTVAQDNHCSVDEILDLIKDDNSIMEDSDGIFNSDETDSSDKDNDKTAEIIAKAIAEALTKAFMATAKNKKNETTKH